MTKLSLCLLGLYIQEAQNIRGLSLTHPRVPKYLRVGSYTIKRPEISKGWVLYIQKAQNIRGLGLTHPKGPKY